MGREESVETGGVQDRVLSESETSGDARGHKVGARQKVEEGRVGTTSENGGRDQRALGGFVPSFCRRRPAS